MGFDFLEVQAVRLPILSNNCEIILIFSDMEYCFYVYV